MSNLNLSGLKEIPLRPYPGYVLVTKNRKVFERACAQLFPERGERIPPGVKGIYVMGSTWWHPVTAVVYWSSPSTLAHELSHVCFGVFDMIGSDPRECREEPFCYLLSQLFLEATQKCGASVCKRDVRMLERGTESIKRMLHIQEWKEGGQ